MKFGALDHVVCWICWNRITLRGKNQEQHHSKENCREDEKLVDDRLFILQVHEDQRHQAGFECSNHQTERDIHGPIMQIDVVGGKNGETRAQEQD